MTARDGGPWRGITEAEQVARIAAGSTPLREFDPKSGEPFRPWIKRCDYCEEGLPKDAEGWHLRIDEEGVEGTARIPCALGLVPPD